MLAVFSLLAVGLDPTEPLRYAPTAYALLAVYLVYALAIAVLTWRTDLLLLHLRIATHAVDLAVSALVMFFTEGPTSPFFVYFVFAMVSAAVRWGGIGTFWTAMAAFASFFGLGLYFAEVLRDPAFELNRFIVRGVYLGVVASLLGYLGVFDQRLRREMTTLARWPRRTPPDSRELVSEVLRHVAESLGVSRLLLVWEEGEEPWLHVASWTAQECEWAREPVGSYEPLVAEPLAEASFLCRDAGAAAPAVLYLAGGRLRRLAAPPLHPALRARFDVGPVLSWRLRGESVEGRLFALDEPSGSLDQLLLGELVVWQVVAHMDQFQLLQRLREAAAVEERVRLARDLHDGVIQSLTVATLRLQALRRLVETDPAAARREVQRLEELLVAEQRELRSFVGESRPAAPEAPRADAGLAARLAELQGRLESHWGLRLELIGDCREVVLSDVLSRQVYRLVHEAVINAARHAGASAVRVGLRMEERQVRIEVEDDGHGFPFVGEYDLPALIASNLGPATLRDRIASLRGSLRLCSSLQGSRLEMAVPLAAGRA